MPRPLSNEQRSISLLPEPPVLRQSVLFARGSTRSVPFARGSTNISMHRTCKRLTCTYHGTPKSPRFATSTLLLSTSDIERNSVRSNFGRKSFKRSTEKLQLILMEAANLENIAKVRVKLSWLGLLALWNSPLTFYIFAVYPIPQSDINWIQVTAIWQMTEGYPG